MQGLPALPHLAREILLALDAGTVLWEELAALAAYDEAAAGALRAVAAHETRLPANAPLEAQLIKLGLARVAEIVLENVAPRLFDTPRNPGLNLEAHWKHSLAVARYARTIAGKIQSPYALLAYPAGLLHDIGKPALDAAIPGGYSRALDLVRQQGLYALEAERRELGADHTVAGKWLAESWGLPAPLVSAIWLHHHPPGTLDNTPYPVELIEIVSLANFLAHGDELETAPQERVAAMDEQRWLRLGLNRIDVIEMLRERSGGTRGEDSPVAPAPAPELAPAGASDDLSRTRQDRDYYAALCAVHEGMQPGLSSSAQLAVLINGLRTAFGIASGLCYLTGPGGEVAEVLRWFQLDSEPEAVPLKGGGASASLDELIAALKDAPGSGAPGAAVHRHGFMALPILDNHRSVGQLIFQAGQGAPALSENFLNSLMRFMRSAGLALARCSAVRGASEEAESLAAAVWKQELSHRNDRRTERLVSVGKIAAGAAHEINNPLAVISGKAQLLLANAERAEDRRALELIVEHSQRASGILRDLLQFARPNPPQLMPSRINAVLRGAADRVRQRLEDEGIQLIEDYAPDLPLVHVDRVQMDQVFRNILENAEQSMTKQGDKLTLRVRPNQDRTAIIIQIIDTGQGIAADVMDKVFEPFFTTRPGNEGTGMGLAVCHGIVEAHRGTITLHSQEGSGTTCTLTLPVSADRATAPSEAAGGHADRAEQPRPDRYAAPRPTAPAAPETAPERPAATAPMAPMAPEVEAAIRARNEASQPPSRFAAESRGSLLLVDQDTELRDVLAEALRGRGYQVTTAADGLEALAEVIANRVDLVILDGGVPGVNAPQALVDEIQRRKPTLPAVLLLGAASPPDLAAGAGPRQILRKPFEVAHLFQMIEQSIAARSVA
ncbi:MAG: HDOD domain-containing protein [Candidatus Hydrogenedentes bacterium]|nr:HDOD domain-containing protein [Candidatus Hydrogenedentota bacterium]